jgi:urea transport system permease protein
MTHRSAGAVWIAILILAASALSVASASAAEESPEPAATAGGPAAGAASGVLDGLVQTNDPHAAVARVVAETGARALPILEALSDGRFSVDGAGTFYVVDEAGTPHRALDGIAAPKGLEVKSVMADNALRREVDGVLAELRLTAPDKKVRFAAAHELALRPSDGVKELVARALASESDDKVKRELSLAKARLDIADPDAAVRKSAVEVLGRFGSPSMKPDLEPLVAKKDDGSNAEPDPAVRSAAEAAIGTLDGRATATATAGNFLYGLSLASVLLFAALGLAITFGVMGIINMAHGEMLMLGSYSTYAVQTLFQSQFPAYADWYLVAAVPVAFVVCFAAGVLLERTVLRLLYGRPLETLLATWGISLGIIQTVRLIFGAQNVAVSNPRWLAGGFELAEGLTLPYSRIAVVIFAVIVSLFVWVVLQRTPLGLQVRAVTQNRGMAGCLGVPTRRIDMLTFGLGSAIAGLGGLAISQLGNVGPELGQGYIVDSFMVVVLGGVGRIAGTVVAAVGLGILNKLLEPFAGAVLGKIAVLAIIILFIQRRPQGLFAVRGRVEA